MKFWCQSMSFKQDTELKHIEKIGLPKKAPALLTFNLSDKNAEHGYVQLNLEAKVIVITPVDKDGYYKVSSNTNYYGWFVTNFFFKLTVAIAK